MPPVPVNARIQPAVPADRDRLATLRRDALLAQAGGEFAEAQLAMSARRGIRGRFPRLLEEGGVLAAWLDGDLVAMGAVDLDSAELLGPYVNPALQGRGLGRKLLVAAEKRAAAHQLFRLAVYAFRPAVPFFRACGYTPLADGRERPDSATGLPRLALRRHFSRRQTRFGRRIEALGAELGIPRDYARRHRLPLREEASLLAEPVEDLYGRPQRMTPRTLTAWRRMHTAAAGNGVALQLVSAYRSVDYQAGLIRRKRDRGLSMNDILSVSAAPGFSEHHTGHALDLATPGAPVLEEAFEDTPAYAWLDRHAGRFGFRLSYPRNNPHGVLYEPWHWYYAPGRAA